MPMSPRPALARRRFTGAFALLLGAGAALAQPAPMCDAPDLAASALARLNAFRAAGADCGTRGPFGRARPLAWNLLLVQAARAHSQDMAARDYFSHASADGRAFSDRISGTGYEWVGIGEDLAAGHENVDEAIDAWMESDSHCATLMNPALTEVGLACVSGGSRNLFRTYWTMDLGQPRRGSAEVRAAR